MLQITAIGKAELESSVQSQWYIQRLWVKSRFYYSNPYTNKILMR